MTLQPNKFVYLITKSETSHQNGGSEVSATVCSHADDAIKEIVNTHYCHCKENDFDFTEKIFRKNYYDPVNIRCKNCEFSVRGQSEKSIKQKQIDVPQTNQCLENESNGMSESNGVSESNDNKSVVDKNFSDQDSNDSDSDNNNDNDNNDSDSDDNTEYSRKYCDQCKEIENVIYEKCKCKYIKCCHEYFRKMFCNNCVRYCKCVNCTFEIGSLASNILNNTKCHQYSYINGDDPVYVGLTISDLTDRIDCKTNWKV